MDDSSVMMALGDYRFCLDAAAYQSLERSTLYRWEAVDRIGVAPGQQFIGPGEDRIDLSGVIYPAFRGGLGQLDEMRAEAGKGEPLMMVDGMGRVWGDFCITEVRETQTVFFSNGTPRKIEFSLTVVAYGGGETVDA